MSILTTAIAAIATLAVAPDLGPAEGRKERVEVTCLALCKIGEAFIALGPSSPAGKSLAAQTAGILSKKGYSDPQKLGQLLSRYRAEAKKAAVPLNQEQGGKNAEMNVSAAAVSAIDCAAAAALSRALLGDHAPLNVRREIRELQETARYIARSFRAARWSFESNEFIDADVSSSLQADPAEVRQLMATLEKIS